MYWNSVHLIDYIRIFARGRLRKVSKIKKFNDNKFSETISKLYFSSKDEHCITAGGIRPVLGQLMLFKRP